MEPTKTEYNLRCPEDGQKVQVLIQSFPDGGSCVTRCTHFGEQTVTCAQQCLEGVTRGTHWEAGSHEGTES